ncbi:MAG TPA: response regulator transcription factor [Actinomycetota bacterium]|nr:response regulator transcription factor [Actinomycetota bacterium]
MAGRSTAVVVDQWPLVRVGVTRALQAVDLRIVGEGGSGADAVALARQHAPDLVVLGSHMDGPLAQTVRTLCGRKGDINVLALVDQAGREELAAMLEAGARGLCPRSVAPEELGDAAKRVLAGERVVAQSLLPALVGMVGPQEVPDQVALLTPKERQVLVWVAKGHSNKEIAEELFMAPGTVKTHLAHIYAKLGVRDRHEAMARAIALGLLG